MKDAEIIRLCRELCGEIEDDTVTTSLVVTKARRLANLAKEEKWEAFFQGECLGYIAVLEGTRDFLISTGRWDGESETFTSASCAALEEQARLWEIEVDALKSFQPAGPYAAVQQNGKMQQISEKHFAILTHRTKISAVRSLSYHFTALLLNSRLFSLASKDIFHAYQQAVDTSLLQNAAIAFEKLPDCFERLQAGSGEAISHALTSCRRIIDAFADSVFPARDEAVSINGQSLDCQADKPKNRILAYLASKQVSGSRQSRIKRGLFDLYDRVSAGVHADVSPDEARALVLQTYFLLGELSLL